MAYQDAWNLDKIMREQSIMEKTIAVMAIPALEAGTIDFVTTDYSLYYITNLPTDRSLARTNIATAIRDIPMDMSEEEIRLEINKVARSAVATLRDLGKDVRVIKSLFKQDIRIIDIYALLAMVATNTLTIIPDGEEMIIDLTDAGIQFALALQKFGLIG